MSDRIETLFDAEVAYLTLNHPPVNVIDFQMIAEISDFLEAMSGEQRLCALVLQATGPAFSGGVDVASHLPETVERMLREFHGLFEQIDDLSVPTIALVGGPCLGGACELAAYMDMVIATENAQFGFPEIKLGVFPPVAASIFPQRFSYQGVMQMLLTGEVLEAPAAVRVGLASRVVPQDQALGSLEELLRSFRQKSATSLRATKRAALEARGPFRTLVAPAERVYLRQLMGTADAVEGLHAFLQKRDPIWKHE